MPIFELDRYGRPIDHPVLIQINAAKHRLCNLSRTFVVRAPMTTTEGLYLALVIVAFLAFAGTLSIMSRQDQR